MKEIKLTPGELKSIIDNNKVIGQGYYGNVVEYDDKVLKIDQDLYSQFRDKSFDNIDYEICKYYEKREKFYKRFPFCNRKQIEDLASKQRDVSLTRLPEGIVTVKSDSESIKDFTPAIILYYHRNYEKLEKLNPKDKKRVLIILKKLLNAVKELEDNKISQEDLVHYDDYEVAHRCTNILYKDNTPQIIDMSGLFVKTGDGFTNANNMYSDLSNVIIDYFYLNDIKDQFIRGKAKTYEENAEMIKVFEKRINKL